MVTATRIVGSNECAGPPLRADSPRRFSVREAVTFQLDVELAQRLGFDGCGAVGHNGRLMPTSHKHVASVAIAIGARASAE